jgi:glycosyltransferase involved in cell wall biosynthesis
MMRVLHVYTGNLYGGIERMLATLAAAQRAVPGAEHEVALCFDGRLERELRLSGTPPHLLGPVLRRRPWTVLRGRARLRRLLAGGGYQAAVCHAAWSLGVFGGTVHRGGVPLVFWQHDFVHHTGWADRAARRARPVLVISNSRASLDTLGAFLPGAPARVLHYPVEPTAPAGGDRESVRAEMGVRPGEVVIVQASRMEGWKGHPLHLEALARIRELPWVCWMAGGAQRPAEARYLEGLRAQAERLGIAGRVRFLGDRRDVPRLLAGADLFCQPNAGPEPFGIAFVEAMYAGLPVVGVAMGGAPEVVDPACGILVPPGDAEALAGALARLVADAGERGRLGAAGPAHARAMCDPARQVRRLNELLAEVAP